MCVCVCVCDVTEAENSGDEEPGLEYLQKELGPVRYLAVCVCVCEPRLLSHFHSPSSHPT